MHNSIFGFFSFGNFISLALPGYYGVYTETAYFVNWIKSVVDAN